MPQLNPASIWWRILPLTLIGAEGFTFRQLTYIFLLKLWDYRPEQKKQSKLNYLRLELVSSSSISERLLNARSHSIAKQDFDSSISIIRLSSTLFSFHDWIIVSLLRRRMQNVLQRRRKLGRRRAHWPYGVKRNVKILVKCIRSKSEVILTALILLFLRFL